MDIYTDSIQNLSEVDKLLLVQRIWSDLSSSDAIPLPEWLVSEVGRRRDQMIADPNLGHTHQDVLDRIRAWRDA
ncbi:addiction module protein [Stieleria varia]|uniref:Putative addiction module component n=1 Tax=Stieleria varia TaxID=2528005 RepID=A0A5C6ANK0_9BACT|nr:addiction module protein [Stieleria varia]TWU00829.1 putative addiction module component [Stieleria varia]